VTRGPTERVRAGIVGTGFAATSHLDGLARLRTVEIAGILGSSPVRTEAAASQLGVEPFGSLDALLDSVDVVHVCSPNDSHGAITTAALDASVHVLSEKPLGLGAAEAERLAEAAERADAAAGVCFIYRHFPLVQQMRALLQEGGDGPVHLVHGAYLQDWLLREDDWNWRLDSSKAGASRATADIGSHWFDLLHHVTGDRVTSVTARLGRIFEERIRPPDGERAAFARGDGGGTRTAVDTEDLAVVLFRTASGVIGNVTVSQVSAGWKNHLVLEVDAAESSYVWDQEEPNRLRIGRREGANRDLVRDPAVLVPAAARLARFPGGHQEGWPDAMRNLFEDFYGAVYARRGGETYEPTFATFGEAARVQATVEAVLRSDAQASWVDVDDVVREVST
jgi:predicted dehydrogenase